LTPAARPSGPRFHVTHPQRFGRRWTVKSKRLDDTVAIITGADDGMAAAGAYLFATEGARSIDNVGERVDATASRTKIPDA
jgi:hypothetical protein